MTNDDIAMIAKETIETLLDLNRVKGDEYRGRNTNALDNFDRLAVKLDTTPEKILLVYMSKHLDAVDTYVRDISDGTIRERSEPIDGRIDDIILYLILLKGMVKRRSEQ